MTNHKENFLKTKILDHIRTKGPLPLYEYMAMCLYDAQGGYYMHHVPMGKEGDFITAPEISQMFGEMIGLFWIHQWDTYLHQAPCALVELGPGRGTLMKDILRTFHLRPALLQNIHLHLLEISPHLRQTQQETLQGKNGTWHEKMDLLLESIKGQPLLCIANEFLDALPVNQYMRQENTWHRRHVTEDQDGFTFAWLPDTPPAILPEWTMPEEIYEYTPDCKPIMEKLCNHLYEYGGIGIFIDYGYGETAPGDTLQGLRRHQYTSPLVEPGKVDITSHVNFHYVNKIAQDQGCATHLMTQEQFLKEMGIEERYHQLKVNLNLDQQEILHRQFMHLTDKMGNLFKVLVVQQKP